MQQAHAQRIAGSDGEDLTGVGLAQARHDAQQGAFAGTVPSDQTRGVTHSHGEADVREHPVGAEGGGDAGNADVRGRIRGMRGMSHGCPRIAGIPAGQRPRARGGRMAHRDMTTR